MKYIVSTTGEKINFMLDANHKFVFDTIMPTQVDDAQFIVLKKRLGVQLKEVPQSTPIEKEVEPEHIDEEM